MSKTHKYLKKIMKLTYIIRKTQNFLTKLTVLEEISSFFEFEEREVPICIENNKKKKTKIKCKIFTVYMLIQNKLNKEIISEYFAIKAIKTSNKLTLFCSFSLGKNISVGF